MEEDFGLYEIIADGNDELKDFFTDEEIQQMVDGVDIVWIIDKLYDYDMKYGDAFDDSMPSERESVLSMMYELIDGEDADPAAMLFLNDGVLCDRPAKETDEE